MIFYLFHILSLQIIVKRTSAGYGFSVTGTCPIQVCTIEPSKYQMRQLNANLKCYQFPDKTDVSNVLFHRFVSRSSWFTERWLYSCHQRTECFSFIVRQCSKNSRVIWFKFWPRDNILSLIYHYFTHFYVSLENFRNLFLFLIDTQVRKFCWISKDQRC